MGKKRKALKAVIESWLKREPPGLARPHGLDGRGATAPSVRTEMSATVFSGDAADWVEYLQTSAAGRYERDIAVKVYVHPDLRLLALQPENDASRWLAELIDAGIRRLGRRLEKKPHVLEVLHQLVFDNPGNRGATLRILLSPNVPSDGTRESDREDETQSAEVRLVLHSRLAHTIRTALDASGTRGEEEKLGVAWPLISRFIANLAFPSAPRDRFVAKIDVHAKLTFVAINTLYDGLRSGTLVPSACGAVHEHMVSQSSQMSRTALIDHHPYFRMLTKLGFMLRAGAYQRYEEEARIVAREYLDTTYLRLSLSGAMPEVPSAMRSMQFSRSGREITTAQPELGRYGILDQEDLASWKAIAKPLRELGFTPLCQLGMGEFGRVYEVLNDNNPELPGRLAIKVDRIVGKKRKAILEAEDAMRIGRALACSPHVIRLYDTGKLSGQRFTYHVLQLIDGDTLDNLLGVTGREHASVSRPPSARASEAEARDEYERAISLRAGELWRLRAVASPFTHALAPAMVLDLLTSVLLWLEEVHELGYAINDLKNGNLMMSRRGQLKGIDLDSYAPIHSPKDKMTDFMFLAVSLILLVFSAPVKDRGRSVPWEQLIDSEKKLRAGLAEAWPFGDVEAISDGRVSKEEMIAVLTDIVQRSRHLHYSKHPERYSEDVVRLIELKRRLLLEEMVVD